MELVEINMRKNFKTRGLDVFIDFPGCSKGKIKVVSKFITEERDLFEEDGQPVCHVNQDNSQVLFDNLWAMGMRPSDGDASIGQLAAVQSHLNDMRKIVSNRLRVIL